MAKMLANRAFIFILSAAAQGAEISGSGLGE